jgi:hypothetical protein
MAAAGEGEPTFLSHPTDIELVHRFLRPRVESGHLDCAWIHEADLYGADPDDLTAGYPAATSSDGEVAWYFFTKLRNKKGYKTRKHRAVPSGIGGWFSERRAKPVAAAADGAPSAGNWETFCFTVKDEDGSPLRTKWLMLQLRLAGDEEEAEPLTLCKVYRTPREKAKAKAASRPSKKAVPSDAEGATSGAHAKAAASGAHGEGAATSGAHAEDAGTRAEGAGTSGAHGEGARTSGTHAEVAGTSGAHAKDAASGAHGEGAGTSAAHTEDDGTRAEGAGTSGAHVKDAASAAHAEDAGTPAEGAGTSSAHTEAPASGTSRAHASGTDAHPEDASSPGVLSTSSPHAQGTKQWLLLEVGVPDEPNSSLHISVNRIYRIRRLEDDDDDSTATPLAGFKRTALQVCSGYLMVENDRAKRTCHGCSSTL